MNALKKITTAAKRIRRAHPKTSWKAAVKEAGRKYRAGKLGSTKTKVGRIRKGVGSSTRKRAVIRKIKRAHKTEGKAIKQLQTLGGVKSAAKGMIKEQLARTLTARELATTKRAKKKLSTKVRELKSQYRKFC